MQLKYVGLPLVAVAAVLFFAWTQKPARVADVTQAVPVAPPKQSSAGGAPWLASLEQRLASLSDRIDRLESRAEVGNELTMADVENLRGRLEAVELQLRQQPAYSEEASVGYESNQGSYTLEASDPRIAAVQLAFENDTRLGMAALVERENVDAIFDNEALHQLEFRQMDCTDRYCRLIYDDLSRDGDAASAIADNELVLLLSQKYVGNITIHGGERQGTSRTIYIELGTH